LEHACELSYGDAHQYLKIAEQNTPFNFLDGPLGQMSGMRVITWRHQGMVSALAARHAAIVGIALSTYRADHSEYPPSLTELVSIYLEAVPLDPFDGQPLRYRRQGDSDYLLYSVGYNQIDDGGTRQTRKESGDRSEWDGDRIFEHVRPESKYTCDPKLEEIKP
ncbi:MAG TPA: hypothetical protein VMV94_12975, partial [Phycisphaerae bacterium]|nr:hypothetical protein [Phycisphaerae bacterium]